jgi:hypothetical protein
MLVALVASLLSPVTGWAMLADHEQLEHAASPEGDHDHEGDAHSMFGHVLSHLPAAFAAAAWHTAAQNAEAQIVARVAWQPFFVPDPPFRPPLP